MEQHPKYMTIGQFCKYSGLSRWHFMRMCDKYHVELVPQGMCKMVDVAQAMTVMKIFIPRLVAETAINRPDRTRDLVEKLRVAILTGQQEEQRQEPQNVA